MKQKLIAAALAGAGLTAVLGAGGLKLYQPFFAAAHAGMAAVTQPVAALPAQGLPVFSSLVDSNGAAVVNISVTQVQKTAAAGPQFRGLDPHDPVFEVFRRVQIPMPAGAAPAPAQTAGPSGERGDR